MRAYLDLLASIMQHGTERDDRTGVGTVALFGPQLRVPVHGGFPLLTTKKLPFRWIAEELFWFLRGDTDEQALRDVGVDIWKEWADEEHTSKFGRIAGDLGPVYGFAWRSFGGKYVPLNLRSKTRDPHPKETWDYGLTTSMHGHGGVDQLARLMYDLKNNPTSRRLIISAWDARAADEVTLPPCHTLFQFDYEPVVIGGVRTQRRRLNCHLYARSVDAFLGLPFNLASYALLTRLIAFCSALEPGTLTISFGNVHVYKSHFEAVQTQLAREPKPLPMVAISDDFWDTGLEGLLAIRYEHLSLLHYKPHPAISAPVAI